MLGEAGGGPERPDFAGDQGERRGRGRLCGRCRFDSFITYGEDDVLNILEASGLRAGDHGSGATAAMVAEVSRLVSRSGTCREKGKEWWRRRGRRLGFDGTSPGG
jgi:hypothetical protein